MSFEDKVFFLSFHFPLSNADMAAEATKRVHKKGSFEWESDVRQMCEKEGVVKSSQQDKICWEFWKILEGKSCEVDLLTQQPIPKDRMLRLYLVTMDDQGNQKRQLRCFDALALKKMIWLHEQMGHDIVDPLTLTPFTKAQILKVKQFALDEKSQQDFDDYYLSTIPVADFGRSRSNAVSSASAAVARHLFHDDGIPIIHVPKSAMFKMQDFPEDLLPGAHGKPLSAQEEESRKDERTLWNKMLNKAVENVSRLHEDKKVTLIPRIPSYPLPADMDIWDWIAIQTRLYNAIGLWFTKNYPRAKLRFGPLIM